MGKEYKETPKGSANKRFIGLVVSNQKAIYAYILSLTLSPNDADDILQDTLALMWERFDGFEPGTSFAAWGKTIARHKIMTFMRDKRSCRLHFNSDLVALLESESSQLENFADRLEALKICAERLSEKEKNLIAMRYEQELPFQKIAMRAGISKQSAYRFISRIHAKLAKCVKLTLSQGGVS